MWWLLNVFRMIINYSAELITEGEDKARCTVISNLWNDFKLSLNLQTLLNSINKFSANKNRLCVHTFLTSNVIHEMPLCVFRAIAAFSFVCNSFSFMFMCDV